MSPNRWLVIAETGNGSRKRPEETGTGWYHWTSRIEPKIRTHAKDRASEPGFSLKSRASHPGFSWLASENTGPPSSVPFKSCALGIDLRADQGDAESGFLIVEDRDQPRGRRGRGRGRFE